MTVKQLLDNVEMARCALGNAQYEYQTANTNDDANYLKDIVLDRVNELQDLLNTTVVLK